MPWGAVLSVGANLLGANIGAKASNDAADTQAAAAREAVAEQRRQYDLTRSDNQPFMEAGVGASKRLRQLLGTGTDDGTGGYGDLTRKFSTSDLNADPVYQSGLQFGLDQGTGAINARALQTGSYDSGATLKALTRYANDYGSTKANDSYNRFNTDNTNTFNRLSGVSGGGQTATNTVSSAGANAANNISNLETQAGNARSAGIVGGANAWGGALNSVGGAFNNYEQNKLLKQYLNGGNADFSGVEPAAFNGGR